VQRAAVTLDLAQSLVKLKLTDVAQEIPAVIRRYYRQASRGQLPNRSTTSSGFNATNPSCPIGYTKRNRYRWSLFTENINKQQKRTDLYKVDQKVSSVYLFLGITALKGVSTEMIFW